MYSMPPARSSFGSPNQTARSAAPLMADSRRYSAKKTDRRGRERLDFHRVPPWTTVWQDRRVCGRGPPRWRGGRPHQVPAVVRSCRPQGLTAPVVRLRRRVVSLEGSRSRPSLGIEVVSPGSGVVSPGSRVICRGLPVIWPGLRVIWSGLPPIWRGLPVIWSRLPVISAGSRMISPRSRAVLPRSRAVLPRSRAVLPRSQAVLPRSQAVLPRSQAVSPRSQAVSPRSQAVSPDREGSPPGRDPLPRDRKPLPGVRARSRLWVRCPGWTDRYFDGRQGFAPPERPDGCQVAVEGEDEILDLSFLQRASRPGLKSAGGRRRLVDLLAPIRSP